MVEHLPWAQGVIPGSWDPVCIGLPAWSLLLPLPVSLPLCVCVSLMNKYIKSLRKNKCKQLMKYIKEDLNGEAYHKLWTRRLNHKEVNSP